MRLPLIGLLFLFAFQVHGEESHEKNFPNGVYVFNLPREIENSNTLILRMMTLVNPWSPEISKTYILYEVVLARESSGALTRNFTYAGREYAVYWSKILVYDDLQSPRYLKYVISADLKYLHMRGGKKIRLRKRDFPKEEVLRIFQSCKGTL